MAKTFAELLIHQWINQNIPEANVHVELTDKNSAVVTDSNGTRGLLVFENGEVRLEHVW